jgi:hypothetical protein
MSWLGFLSNLSLLITVGVDVIVLCHVFPAYRRSRNRAFLFIAIACLFGIVGTAYDHLVILRGVSDPNYTIIRTLRRLGYFADCIFWCIGIVLLARPYLNGSRIRVEVPSSEVSHPQGSRNQPEVAKEGKPPEAR